MDIFQNRYIVFAGIAAIWIGLASAATLHVDSLSNLQSAIDTASPGDRIIVADGIYTTTNPIRIRRSGTEDKPIIVEATTVGGVILGGTHGFTLDKPAACIHIKGFRFTHAAGGNTINSGTTFCQFTRNIFECSGKGYYLLVAGDDAQINYNEFRNKGTVGNMIDVRGEGNQVAQRVWIHHNYFHDFTNAGANGAETIRFGLSGLSMSTGNGLIEHNLFARCRGENELISNKSCGNKYRYNTFLNSAGAQLTLRHGNDCLAYGNYFRNTDGLRIYGDRHRIFSNYFESNTKGIDMGNGDGEVTNGSALTCHDRPDDCVVVFNTFINNKVHYQMGGRKDGLGARNIMVANNIMQGGDNIAAISKTAPYTGTWSGNIEWKTGGAGDMSPEGFKSVDPLLAADVNGIYHLQSGSPAIASAIGAYPYVTIDMDGQRRDEHPDVGADEYSKSPASPKVLAVEEVGPFCKQSVIIE
ncbi:MAG: polysaccharide lyase 6 family protein [Anaerohalosphaeraceae bacterium]